MFVDIVRATNEYTRINRISKTRTIRILYDVEVRHQRKCIKYLYNLDEKSPRYVIWNKKS